MVYKDSFGKTEKFWVDKDNYEKLKNGKFKDAGVKAFVDSLSEEYKNKKKNSVAGEYDADADSMIASISLYIPYYLKEMLSEEFNVNGLEEIAEQIK